MANDDFLIEMGRKILEGLGLIEPKPYHTNQNFTGYNLPELPGIIERARSSSISHLSEKYAGSPLYVIGN